VPILDVHAREADQSLLARLPGVVAFIAAARSEGTGVLVHCLWGISRSVTLLLAYMISPQVLLSLPAPHVV
jgi:protein-tyrosine phosphatase